MTNSTGKTVHFLPTQALGCGTARMWLGTKALVCSNHLKGERGEGGREGNEGRSEETSHGREVRREGGREGRKEGISDSPPTQSNVKIPLRSEIEDLPLEGNGS